MSDPFLVVRELASSGLPHRTANAALACDVSLDEELALTPFSEGVVLPEPADDEADARARKPRRELRTFALRVLVEADGQILARTHVVLELIEALGEVEEVHVGHSQTVSFVVIGVDQREAILEELEISYVTGSDGVRHATLSDGAHAYVKNFIKETAAKSAPEISSVIQEGHDAVIRNIEGLTDEQARHKPAPDIWSALETMAHIVTVKRISVALTSNLAAGNLPPGFGPQLENESAQDGVTFAKFETIAEAREAAESAHTELLAIIENIDDANLETRFRHFFFGAMNAREWACFQRIHDGDHFPQLASVKASAGFPSS